MDHYFKIRSKRQSSMLSALLGSIGVIAAMYLGGVHEVVLRYMDTATSFLSLAGIGGNISTGSTNVKVYTQESMLQEMIDRSTENHQYLLLSVAGHVFNVSAGSKFYGEGGSYSFFTGGDFTRAYGTGDFSSEG